MHSETQRIFNRMSCLAGMVEVVLNRPESRNAIGTLMLEQFRNVFEAIHHDPLARVLILRSGVPGVFCAGADLKVPFHCISVLV